MKQYNESRRATKKEIADYNTIEAFLDQQDDDVFFEVIGAASTNACDPRKVRALNAVCRKYNLVPEVVMNWYYCDEADE